MGTVEVKNILGAIPAKTPEEFLEVLAESKTVRIERIVSQGHSSPEGFWYDQKADEFVMVIKGRARLLFDGDHETVSLTVGDYMRIPARCKHRVEWTDPDEETVWLAVHYG